MCNISTHAPLRGATPSDDWSDSTVFISTHAPLRGATHCPAADRVHYCISTHAPLRGATASIAMLLSISTFLLTRLCEARLKSFWNSLDSDSNFYSRASARRDRIFVFFLVHQETFLLTRLCEARPMTEKFGFNSFGISTHAPLRGATKPPSIYLTTYHNFYSRASARRDLPVFHGMTWKNSFLLTRLCEARLVLLVSVFMNIYISTHAPLRGATATFST